MPTTDELKLHGCDVSDYQDPKLVDWTKLDFGIVKATDGKRPMKRTRSHVDAIRKAGITLGLYHFLRADSSIQDQFKAFAEVAIACKLGAGDLLPCIDIEDYPGFKLESDPRGHSERAREFAIFCRETFGGAILYIKAYDWMRLGKPGWMLEHPLWVAHYPKEGSTQHLMAPAAIAGRSYRIWQRMVGPLGQVLQKSDSPKAVDQNIATSPLPLITDRVVRESPDVRIPWVFMTEEVHLEMRAARDRQFKRELEKELP
jgi:GH25 family lysozyme M1 (1,4-beta-N-acetylmuramidase)